jgi:hypothetical protein
MSESERGAWNRERVLPLAALVLFALLQLFLVPRSVWEFDESFFLLAVEDYNPLMHHPPPPGYPLFIGVAKVVAAVVGGPFNALRVISWVGSVAGVALLYLILRRLTVPVLAACAGALLFYASPAMLVHSTLPISDPAALALLFLAILTSSRAGGGVGKRAILPLGTDEPASSRAGGGAGKRAIVPLGRDELHGSLLFAISAAAAIGWRPQLSIIILPLLFATLFRIEGWRRRFLTVVIFGLACLAWFIPLTQQVGGFERWYLWTSGQADYFAEHDAAISRSGWSPASTAMRFIAHPWGPKWLSFPLLLAAALGVLRLLKQRRWEFMPIAFAAACYLAFALAVMDPADGVRYSLPSTSVIALAAAFGIAALGRWSLLAVAIWTAGALAYALPVVMPRVTSTAPPSAAAEWIRRNVPAGSTILFELPLRPHSEWLLRDYRIEPVDEAFARGALPERAWIYAADRSLEEGAVNFGWPWSDAYDKLTRTFYRAASVIPLTEEEHFRRLSGVYALERDRNGVEWRWLDGEARVEIPDLDADALELRLALPPESSLETNEVVVSFEEQRVTQSVRRGEETTIRLPLAERGGTVVIRSGKAVIPASLAGTLNHDPRRLAVQLRELEQVGARR